MKFFVRKIKSQTGRRDKDGADFPSLCLKSRMKFTNFRNHPSGIIIQNHTTITKKHLILKTPTKLATIH